MVGDTGGWLSPAFLLPDYHLRQTLILKKINHWTRLVIVGVCFGIVTGLFADVLSQPYVQEVQAATIKEEPKKVRLEVVINWTPERIEKEIRTTFKEAPNTAVAIAKAEGGLVKERQSDFYKDGVRERSFCAFQIHEPSWDKKAKHLGYGDYKSNPEHCVAMARYIYDHTGKNFNQWSAYTEGKYKKFL